MKSDYITEAHILEAISSSAGIIKAAALKLGVSRSTLHAWIAENEILKAAVNEAREDTLDLAEAGILTLIKNGDREACRFYLRCFGKKRGWIETVQVENKGAPLLLIAPPATAEEAEAITADLAEKF